MATRSKRRSHDALPANDKTSGSGGFVGQVGLFETANGLPHGPLAVALAIVAAIVIYPITRVVRMLRRR